MKIVIEGKSIWINYHHLYCFYRIVHYGSITSASKNLGIGQSALSIQMKQFENQLGFSLFDRSHRKISVNERGKIVLSYAKEIFRLGGEMIETLNDRSTSNRIHLQIGALDTIPKHLTVQLVNEAVINRSSVSILEGKLDELLKQLVEHKMDLVVSNYLPQTEPGRIYAKRIARLPLWIVGGKSFVKFKKKFPQSLQNLPFIVPTADSRVRQELESFVLLNNLKIDSIVETQDIMVQKLLATQNIGLSIMPEFAVKQFLKKRELFLIGKIPDAFEEIFLISAERKIQNPVASLLMKQFRIV